MRSPNKVVELKKLFAVAAALVLTACGSAGVSTRPAPLPPVQRVANWNTCLDIWFCQDFRPWRRPDDAISGQVFWFISESGYGCIVGADDFVMVRRGDRVACQWRAPRS